MRGPHEPVSLDHLGSRCLAVAGVVLVGLTVAGPGCARNWVAMSDRKTCVVLSAGGPTGLAHIGALEALRRERIPIDCVTGTSMGALIGSLYAAAPDVPVRERYVRLLDEYTAETMKAGARNALIGGVVGGVVAAVFSKGDTLPILGGVGAGAVAGAKLTDEIDLDRFTTVLDRAYSGQLIETLPVPYATFFQQRQGTNVALVVARAGNVAAAVGKSIANPFIFPSFDPVKRGYVDPAADRLAATPIDDTCRAFPGARLLAVNASGQASRYGHSMTCPLLEVWIDADPVKPEALRGKGADFERVVRIGFDRTRAAIAAERAR